MRQSVLKISRMEIVNTIIKYQEKAGLTDVAFTGTDRFMWSHIKAGRRKPNEKFLRRVGNRYPALQPAITEYLFADAKEAR